MNYSIKNKTGKEQSSLLALMHKFMPYASSQLEYSSPVKVVLLSDPDNAKKPLGKTAFYNPDTFTISIFTDNRHMKDILRSLSHELIHHVQNDRGDFDKVGPFGENYIQTNPHLRKMEDEAYLLGKETKKPKEEKTGNTGVDYNRKRKQVVADELMKRWIKK